MQRVLFVCMGNICRSPAAEGVLKRMLDEKGMPDVEVDSAGTIAYHAGEPADARMREFAAKRDYCLDSISRKIVPEDLETFDWVITMDQENYKNVCAIDPSGKNHSKVKHFCDFCMEHTEKEVPDPYYGGDQGFELVMDLIEDGCRELCNQLKT